MASLWVNPKMLKFIATKIELIGTCVFSSYIGVKDSNKAKFVAIIFVLEVMLVKKI